MPEHRDDSAHRALRARLGAGGARDAVRRGGAGAGPSDLRISSAACAGQLAGAADRAPDFVFASASWPKRLSYHPASARRAGTELGNIIAGGRDFMVEAPWITIFPGLAVVALLSGSTCSRWPARLAIHA